MPHQYLLIPVVCLCLPLTASAQQPFEQFGVKVKILSLSNGRYPEYFPNDSLRRIGSVVYDTRLKRVASLLPADSLRGRVPSEVTSRWLAVDPLAEQYAHVSPYVFVDNNPVNHLDPDGREIIYHAGKGVVDKRTGVTTVTVRVDVSVKALNQSQLSSDAFASRVADFKTSLTDALSNEHMSGKTRYIFQAGKVDVQVASDMKQVKSSDHLMVMVDEVTGQDNKGGPRGGTADFEGKVAYVQTTEGGENMVHEFGHNMGLDHNWNNAPKDDDGPKNYMSYESGQRNTFSGGQLYRSMHRQLNQRSNSSTMAAPGMVTPTTTQAKPYRRAAEGERVPKPLP